MTVNFFLTLSENILGSAVKSLHVQGKNLHVQGKDLRRDKCLLIKIIFKKISGNGNLSFGQIFFGRHIKAALNESRETFETFEEKDFFC